MEFILDGETYRHWDLLTDTYLVVNLLKWNMPKMMMIP